MGLYAQNPAQVLHAFLPQEFIRHHLHGAYVTDVFHDDRHQHHLCLISPEFPEVFQFPQPLNKLREILLHDFAEYCKIPFVFFSLLRSGLVMVKLLCEKILPIKAAFTTFSVESPYHFQSLL